TDVVRRARLIVDGDTFNADIVNGSLVFEDMDLEIAGDDTYEVELQVRLVRNATSTAIKFNLSGSDIAAEGLDSGIVSPVSGAADSALHQIATTGLIVEAVSTSQQVYTPNNSQPYA